MQESRVIVRALLVHTQWRHVSAYTRYPHLGQEHSATPGMRCAWVPTQLRPQQCSQLQEGET